MKNLITKEPGFAAVLLIVVSIIVFGVYFNSQDLFIY
jgi:hypothetical protein